MQGEARREFVHRRLAIEHGMECGIAGERQEPTSVLSAQDIADLESGSAAIGVTGARYPETALRQVGL